MTLVTQPSRRPTRKWFAATSTGGGALVLVWVLHQLGVEMPPEVAAAVVLGAAQAAAYVRKNAPVLRDCLDRGSGRHTDRDGDGLPG